MPHRTTYFFPRQVPDGTGFGTANSSNFPFGHEKGIIISDSDVKSTNVRDHQDATKSTSTSNSAKSRSSVGGRVHHGKQLADFVNWFGEKKSEGPPQHVKIRLADHHDHELLLPPPPHEVNDVAGRDVHTTEELEEIDQYQTHHRVVVGGGNRDHRYFDSRVSLQRVSSESSYANSLFSRTTLDGNASSLAYKDDSATTREEENQLEMESSRGKDQSSANKLQESYYLQLTLAKRLSWQATIGSESTLQQECGYGGRAVCSDPESVSYRLWVTGCLSYNDRISDGFYNILGMNPFLWAMCNTVEESRRLPSLVALKAVDPGDTSMEVVLVDRYGDSRLRELEDRAQDLYFSATDSFVLAKELGKLVGVLMGGSFLVEQGDLHLRWKLDSMRLRDLQKCAVVPVSNMSMGLCRHRAILFKRLADYVGLPCRVARGCKYCDEDL